VYYSSTPLLPKTAAIRHKPPNATVRSCIATPIAPTPPEVSPDKILVYKNAKRPLSDNEPERMCLAIRRYGNNTLLYVRYQTEEHRFPSVISPAPGLLIGHINTMGLKHDGPETRWA
jgi:hypothetical protein